MLKCKKKVILGSGSPRRKELLEQIGLEFEVVTSDCEEIITCTEPFEIVQELARTKAEAVLKKLTADVTDNCEKDRLADDADRILVIGADTIVAAGDKILGKPVDAEDAVAMIRHLQGNTHQVYTGVCFAWKEEGQVRIHSFYEVTQVEVLPMTEGEIRYYVGLDTCMDKAGAYGIQNEFACYVKGIRGDYNNVVGLPAGRVYQELKKLSLFKLQTD